MTLEEILLLLQGEKDLTAEDLKNINATRKNIAESLKMSLDSFGSSQKILEKLNESPATPADEDIDVEEVIQTPAEDFTDDKKEE